MALARAYLVLERDGQNSIFIHRVVLFCGFLIFDQDFWPSSFSDSQSKRMVGWCSLFFGIFTLQQVKIQVNVEEKSKRKKRWANEETTIYCYVAMVLMMSFIFQVSPKNVCANILFSLPYIFLFRGAKCCTHTQRMEKFYFIK